MVHVLALTRLPQPAGRVKVRETVRRVGESRGENREDIILFVRTAHPEDSS